MRWLIPIALIAAVLTLVLAFDSLVPVAARARPTADNPFIASLQYAAPFEVAAPSSLMVSGVTPVPSPADGQRPRSVPVSTPRTHAVGSPLLAGFATWYANGPGIFGAAGPDLRRAVGDWRGAYVVVTGFTNGQAHSATVLLSDWCLCTGAHQPRLIDLSVQAFLRVCGSLSLGVCRVEIQWT